MTWADVRRKTEQLILGSTGTTRTIAPGRFHLISPDAIGHDGQPTDAIERAVDVTLNPGESPSDAPMNPADGTWIMSHRETVRVSYLLTGAGGDLAESIALGEQQGAGTVDAVEARAMLDAHDIIVCLTWHENHTGTDPVIITRYLDGAPQIQEGDGIAIIEIPFRLLLSVTNPGTYAA